ncbi:radical SAM protein [Gammaproteobacteria bacterium]|nr:radical SAM protein [Gammaproteobacteria bacterium]
MDILFKRKRSSTLVIIANEISESEQTLMLDAISSGATVNKPSLNDSPELWEKWVPNKKIKWQLNIDIVGSCNLRCPSCPVGNLRELKTTEPYMRPELLDQIIRKAMSECRVTGIDLYNWTEPFLHPNLSEMIKVVRSHGLPCGISTNLNLLKKIDSVMEANPQEFKVSLSGFTQDVYGKSHREGNIEVVKKNMVEVAHAKKRTGSNTRLVVAYHRYLGNHQDEKAMQEYSASLGFEFEPAWAYFMPLEKMLAYVESEATEVKLNQEDQNTLDLLALPLDGALEISKSSPNIGTCPLRSRQMAITSSGEVMLCCATYDQSQYSLGKYLDLPLNELQEMKYQHNACSQCMTHGVNVLYTYNSHEFDDLGLDNITKHFPDAKLQRVKPLNKKSRPRGFSALPFKIKREFNRLMSQISSGS